MKIRTLALVSTAILLAGCGQGNTDGGYCGNHREHHPNHADSIGRLSLRYTEDGIVEAEVSIPRASLSGPGEPDGDAFSIQDTANLLKEAGQVFSISGAEECLQRQSRAISEEDNVTADYRFDCGADNRLEDVDIRLLEHLPALDELEAHIDTPAVGKKFLISRQCETPLYNY